MNNGIFMRYIDTLNLYRTRIFSAISHHNDLWISNYFHGFSLLCLQQDTTRLTLDFLINTIMNTEITKTVSVDLSITRVQFFARYSSSVCPIGRQSLMSRFDPTAGELCSSVISSWTSNPHRNSNPCPVGISPAWP
jgi:hypothetical protein